MRDSSHDGTPSLPHQPGSLRELLWVAVPLVLSSGSLSLMHVVDRVFLTWSGEDALAASLPAGLLHWTVMSVFIGTATYVNTFVAQYDGAGRKDRVVASVWQGIYLALCGGVCVTALFVPLAGPIFTLAGHKPAVEALEIEYFSTLCFGATPMIMAAAMSAFFSGRGRTRVLMYVNFMIAVLNMGLDFGMIFGHGPFPEMGIRGAALATVISQSTGVLLYALLILRERNRDGYAFFVHRRFHRELFGRLLRYGFPTGMQYLSDVLGFLVFIFLVGRIGNVEQAATNLAFNLNTMAFVPMIGFGTAVMTLVGRRIGEGRPQLAVRTTWQAFGLCSAYMLTFVAIYLFLPDVILYPYSLDAKPSEFAEIRPLVVRLLRFVAIYSFFDGMLIVFSSAVRGAGDTRFSMIFTLFAGWSLMVLPTWIVWTYFTPNLFAAWTAVSVYITVAGFGFLIRFQAGRWKTMRVIEPVDAEPSTDDAPVSETVPANPAETVTAFNPATALASDPASSDSNGLMGLPARAKVE
ncbi:MAG: MATE family efflux transporter [Planctomycetaceae bacterium]